MNEFEVTDGSKPMILGEPIDIIITPTAHAVLRVAMAPGFDDLDRRKRKRLIRRAREGVVHG